MDVTLYSCPTDVRNVRCFVPELSIPKLPHQCFKKAYLKSGLQEQRCKNDLYQAAHTYDWHAAKQINIDEWNQEFQTSDADLEKAIQKLEKEEKHRLTEIAVAGNTCLVSIGIAMVALVVMAFLNFMN